MLTEKGDNTFVVAINGNFDDAQRGVKEIFEDQIFKEELAKENYQLSSANSINIGRLVPQVVYYVYTYANLLKNQEIKSGDFINVTVPTGNFGNILAAYYAKEMGVPIDKLICASNENKVLFDFFETGCYNKNREFVLTSSPSMDILVSSNLERLIYEISGRNCQVNLEFMNSLNNKGEYTITSEMKERLKDFIGGYSTEEDTKKTIKKVYEKAGYALDPHTAVATYVLESSLDKLNLRNENTEGVRENLTGNSNRSNVELYEVEESSKDVIISTASPYKFVATVMTALDSRFEDENEFNLISKLEEVSEVKIPNALQETLAAKVNKEIYCDKKDMKDVVRRIKKLWMV
jgi:threonine synthase